MPSSLYIGTYRIYYSTLVTKTFDSSDYLDTM